MSWLEDAEHKLRTAGLHIASTSYKLDPSYTNLDELKSELDTLNQSHAEEGDGLEYVLGSTEKGPYVDIFYGPDHTENGPDHTGRAWLVVDEQTGAVVGFDRFGGADVGDLAEELGAISEEDDGYWDDEDAEDEEPDE